MAADEHDAGNTSLPSAYWRLWTAGAISNLGDGVLATALALLAARITDNATSVGLIATFFSIPWLLFSVPAGVVIDRFDRRTIMVVADLCRGALVGGLALVAAFTDVQMWMLWVLAFGLGLGEVFFDNGSQSILPVIVANEQLERANGYFYATEVATNTFLGLPLGSLLFGVVVWLPFGLDAVSFVVAALLATTLRGSFRPHHEGPRAGAFSDMRSGFKWLLHHHLLRNLAIGVGLMNFAFAATQATFVLFATRELHISVRSFGPLVAIIGTGSLVAGVLGGRIVDKVGRRFAMLVAGFAPVLTSLATGLVPITWWMIAMTTVQALMTTIWSIVAVSLRQQIVPEHLFGRVNSVYRWVSTGVMPVGALAGGLVAQRWGLRAPYFMAAGLLFVAYLVVARRLTSVAIAGAITASPAGSDPAATTALDDTPVSMERDPLDDLL